MISLYNDVIFEDIFQLLAICKIKRLFMNYILFQLRQ